MSEIIGIDVGGTFTDVISIDPLNRRAVVAKVLSNSADQSTSVIAGINLVDATFEDSTVLVHGTTVGTNALIERNGGTVGLITTHGFRDVLELRRRDRPQPYGLTGEFHPLVPRHLRKEVQERVDAAGRVLVGVDTEEVVAAGEELLKGGCEVVVVAFIHSYANNSNELAAVEALRGLWPNNWIVAAGELLPEYQEFERTSTAVVNGYLLPPVGRYLDRVAGRLQELGYQKDLLVVQSNGGVMSLPYAARTPGATMLSGPAAGTVAASWVAEQVGANRAISFDMGGTSLDVCLIVDGRPLVRNETQMEFGMPIRFSIADIHTIGAGGGSIAHLDRAGMLRVGPRSAGASPGPASYGLGGNAPTLTDANLLLGRLGTDPKIGQDRIELDTKRAAKAMAKIAEGLDLSIEEAAEAVVTIADHQSAGAVRLISVERGHDPRDFVLVAYGGSGGLHAASLLEQLAVKQVVVPAFPGITSALGCVLCDLRHDFVQTIRLPLDELDTERTSSVFASHISQGLAVIEEEGEVEGVQIACQVEMSYEGQTHLVRATLPTPDADSGQFRTVFEDTYQARFGYKLADVPITVMNLRTSVVGIRPSFDKAALAPEPEVESDPQPQDMFVGGDWIQGTVYERGFLRPGQDIVGPAVIRQSDATSFVQPEVRGICDDFGNLILEPR